MAVFLAQQYTQRTYRWTEWKALYAVKGLPFQYDDDGNLYTIWTYDESEVHVCQIWKQNIPNSLNSYSQEQNDSDKSDFEANYKNSGNLSLGQIDTDGAQIVRIKAAKRGWSFWAIPVEITTSTIGGSLFCQFADGTNIPWITCKIYDNADQEITTPGLLNANLGTCVKTVVDFEPTFDYEIIGGNLRVNSNPSQDIRLWIIGAPDIPAGMGGSKEFASGVNLKFLAPDSTFEVDGRVTKALKYDAVTHQGKMRILLKHPAGTQINLQVLVQIYRQ